MYSLAKHLLFRLDAEQAHGLALKAIEAAYRSGLNPLVAAKPPVLRTKAFGITFSNPVRSCSIARARSWGWRRKEPLPTCAPACRPT